MDNRRDGYVKQVCVVTAKESVNGNACWQLVSADIYSKVYS